MNLTITISVTEDPNVSIKMRARGVSEDQVRPVLQRALGALHAEISALETCPYHAPSHQAASAAATNKPAPAADNNRGAE